MKKKTVTTEAEAPKGKPGRKPKAATATAAAKSPEPAKTAAQTKAKPVASRKRATAAPAVKKAAKPVPSEPAKVIVRHNAGWGNSLHLRGEGAGLSWETGVPLICTGDAEWTWVAPLAAPVAFKLLLNDTIWALGDNLVIVPGETITITPAFD